jgi:hypothetical protein
MIALGVGATLRLLGIYSVLQAVCPIFSILYAGTSVPALAVQITRIECCAEMRATIGAFATC